MKTWRDLPGFPQRARVGEFGEQLLDEIEAKIPIEWEMRYDYAEWLIVAKVRGIIDALQLEHLLEYSATTV